MVLVGRVVALYVVDGLVILFWVSLGLREDDKNVVPFKLCEHEQLGRVGSLLWVVLGLWGIGGSIPSFEVDIMIESSIVCAASGIMTPSSGDESIYVVDLSLENDEVQIFSSSCSDSSMPSPFFPIFLVILLTFPIFLIILWFELIYFTVHTLNNTVNDKMCIHTNNKGMNRSGTVGVS